MASPFRRVVRAARLQAECDAWNAKHAVGTVVDVTKDLGNVVRTKTRSEAQVLSGHTPVIWLDGISGCYLLERVKAVDAPPGDHGA